MKRREFIAGLGGALGWSLAVRAQQRPPPVIGYLSASSRETTLSLAPFLEGLKPGSSMARTCGSNIAGRKAVTIACRQLAADLVDRRAAVLVATGGPFVTKPAMTATSTTPIVFQGGGPDPVKEAVVSSLAHPGGNVTGVMNLAGSALAEKQVELLRALLPTAPSIGLLVKDTGPGKDNAARAEEAARALQREFYAEYAHDDDGLERAFARLAEWGVGGLVVGDPFLSGRRARIVALAARYAIPASYFFRDFVLELWPRSEGYQPRCWSLRRQYPQGREARRPAGAAGHKRPAVAQPPDREGARRHIPDRAAGTRRRGGRMKRREFIAGLGC